MDVSTPLLQVERVSIQRSSREILKDITLEVRPGEVLALVGPNGAGKSSLLSVLAGEIRPASGRALIGGEPTTELRPKELARRRSVLLQANDVSFPFEVRQVVAMGRNPWAGTEHEADDEQAIIQAMQSVGVSELAQRKFNELSGGERARVSLARVLAQDTDVMLLDEPTAALDLHHQDRVMHLVRSRATGGRAVVVVVHDLTLAAAYADRVALLVEGRLVAEGTPREVITPERLSDVYGVSIQVIDSPDGHPIVVPMRGTV